MQSLYTAEATVSGGRDGKVTTTDHALELKLTTPKELGGAGGAGSNPEQLFAAGYAACFESALRLVARMQKKTLTEASITARVTLGKSEAGAYGLAVTLIGHLPGVPREEARALMAAAHGVCPYSNATRNNIDVTLDVTE